MAPLLGLSQNWRCAISILVPLLVATITLLASTVMVGVSHDESMEAHRLQRETVWDIPVMDTLRLWKRSMGTVGSGKVKLSHHYTDGEIQVDIILKCMKFAMLTSFAAALQHNPDISLQTDGEHGTIFI